MTKITTTICIDYELSIALKNKPDFNVSRFCNDALKRALDVKEIAIPKEEEAIEDEIKKRKVELSMMEVELKKIVKKRKEEEDSYHTVEEMERMGRA